VYPRVGRWPRYSLLRRLLIRAGSQRRGFESSAFRLPSMIYGTFADYTMVRWVVPIDAKRCRNFMWLTSRQEGWGRVGWLLRYWLWHRWVFTKRFTAQDQRIVERLDYSAPEQLFRPDGSIVGLRRYIEANARWRDPVPADA
jgi:hypothetical protein